jgi:type IV fimbrial biogenesis protein FimT
MRNVAAFTLVELILVMAILAVVMALSAPSLSRSLRERALEQEAARFQALTLFARNEAVSEGVAMAIWIDPGAKRYGLEPKSDYGGNSLRRDYGMDPDVEVEVVSANRVGTNPKHAIGFTPSGVPDTQSAEAIRLTDRFGSTRLIQRREDLAGYQIVKEGR